MIEKTKRYVSWFLAGISFCLLFIYFVHESRTPDTAKLVRRMTGTELIAGRREKKDLLTDLALNGQHLIFDETDMTWYYSLIEDDDKAMSPKVTFESPEKHVQIVFSEEITEDIIRNDLPVAVTAYNDRFYETYQLKCTTLPIMSLTVGDEITREDTDMIMDLMDNSANVSKRSITSAGTVHIRGRSSAAYPQTSFRLSLTVENSSKKNHISLLGMREDEDWLLVPAYADIDKVRTAFSANLWTDSCGTDNSFGIVNGNYYKYMELFINGRYWGLYTLSYPIDQKTLDVDAGKGEYIYKKRFWDEGSAVDFVSSTWEVTNPYNEQDNPWIPIQNYYHLLNEQADDAGALKRSVDMNTAIDLWLYYGLIQGVDNADHSDMENTFMTARLGNDGTYKMLYTPWDMDLTWGELITDETCNTIMESGALAQLISMGNKETIEAIYRRYHVLRENAWSVQNIDSYLDQYETSIFGSGAYYRQAARWPESTYDIAYQDLSVFRNYVHRRLTEFDAFIERWYGMRDKSVYVMRSSQYKDFTKWKFIIQVNDHEILHDPDYRDLFTYIGLNISDIPDDAWFVLYDGETKTVEYRDWLGEERVSLYTSIGRIIYERPAEPRGIGDDFLIYLDGEPVLEIWQWPEEPLRMGMIYNHASDEFNFETINSNYLVD